MAVTKIIKVRSNVPACIKYVTNEKKTDEKRLVSYSGCNEKNAAAYFELCQGRNTGRRKDKGDILAYHVIQSFAKDDPITPEQAHEIGLSLMQEMFGDSYAYTLATHIDKGHIHNHVCMCAFDKTLSAKKLNDDLTLLHKLRRTSDKLCRENGLSVIEKPTGKAKSYKEWLEDLGTGKGSLKTQLRRMIDKAIFSSATYDDFIKNLTDAGVEIGYGNSKKYGTVTKYKLPGEMRFNRGYSLGSFYSDDAIKERIHKHVLYMQRQTEIAEKKKEMAEKRRQEAAEARKAAYDAMSPAEKKLDKSRLKIDRIKDTSAVETDGSKRSLSRWMHIQNAKRLQEINKRLTDDYGISFAELSGKISSMKADANRLGTKLDKSKKDIETLRSFVDDCVLYKHYKIYETNMKKAADPDEYYRTHDLKLDAYFDAKARLTDRGIDLSSLTFKSLDILKERLQKEEDSLNALKKDKMRLEEEIKSLSAYEKELDTYFKREHPAL